jgi:hypothetical protein
VCSIHPPLRSSIVRRFVLLLQPLGGEIDDDIAPVLKYRHDFIYKDNKLYTSNDNHPPPSIIDMEDLVGKSFIMYKQDDGQQFQARIVKLIEDHDERVENNKDWVKVLLSLNDDTREEVITYNKLLGYLAKDSESETLWKLKRITSHQGPLLPSHPDYKGSSYNLMIECENGEVTSEPLQVIAKDGPVTCEIYAKNGLLSSPGWKQFKSIASRKKKFSWIVHQAKLRSFNIAPRFKIGFENPRTFEQEIRINERVENTKFQDATALELQQMRNYQTFIDKGHHTKTKPPDGYKKI